MLATHPAKIVTVNKNLLTQRHVIVRPGERLCPKCGGVGEVPVGPYFGGRICRECRGRGVIVAA